MNKTVFNVLKWVAICFVAIYILVQFYSSVIEPVTTDTVYTYSSFSGYSTKGCIIRNETIIELSGAGSVGYKIESGGRVAKNGVIAELFASDADAEASTQSEQLDKRIASLEKIQSYNDLNAADLTTLSSKIRTALIETANATQDGFVSDESDSRESLLELINRRQIITGETKDFSALISSLKEEKSRISSSSAATGTLRSPASGYVIYSVDGYENVLTSEKIEELTAEKMQNLTAGEPSDSAVCKIVGDYEWYIAAVVPFSESLNMKEGSSVTVRTALRSAPELDCTVKLINKQSVQDNAVVILSCNTMNTELASTRYFDITVIYKEYKGLKVDNRAIRVVDGTRGVYVVTASQVKFVPVNILWSGENYSIVEQQASTSKVLRIYDEIVVKGKNLYDGKIIR